MDREAGGAGGRYPAHQPVYNVGFRVMVSRNGEVSGTGPGGWAQKGMRPARINTAFSQLRRVEAFVNIKNSL